jgi:hypothetical protein
MRLQKYKVFTDKKRLHRRVCSEHWQQKASIKSLPSGAIGIIKLAIRFSFCR